MTALLDAPVRPAVAGPGQSPRLRTFELIEQALVALPGKRLCADLVSTHLISGGLAFCTIGAVARLRGWPMDTSISDRVSGEGLDRGVCAAAIRENDGCNCDSMEDRYDHMLAWARRGALDNR